MFATLDNAANLKAIDQYMGDQRPVTSDGAKAKDAWRVWYDALGWSDREFPSQATYDYARNLKNKYDLANVKSTAEKAAVVERQQSGLSSEQLRGEADRRLASGSYSESDYEEETEPFFPTRVKVLGAVIGLGAVAALYVKKVYLDRLSAFVPRGRS